MTAARAAPTLPALAVAAAALAPGCGFGLLQDARTTPRGQTDVQLAVGYLHNESVEERGRSIGNYVPHVGARRGLTDRVDLGLSMFMMLGMMVDAKVALAPPGRPLALSAQAGLAAAAQADLDGARVVHVPVRALASYDLGHGVTPYGALGWGHYWIFDYGDPQPDVTYAGREGYGDGVATLTLGCEVGRRGSTALLVEYDYWRPVVDDPGDFYSFRDNHFFLVGMVIR